jgi:hypothetical protein
MKTRNLFTVLAISAITIMSACQKEYVLPELAEPKSGIQPDMEKGRNITTWRRIESLPEGPIYNLAYENGEILAIGNSFRYRINPSNSRIKSEYFGAFSEDFSTSLNQEFFTKVSGSTIYVFSTQNPQSSAKVDIKMIDPFFEGFSFMEGCFSKSIAVNQNNVFLTVYNRFNETGTAVQKDPYIILFRAVINKSGQVVISNIITVPIKDSKTSAKLLTVFPMGEKFLLSVDSKTYVVCQQGQYSEVLNDGIYEVIPFNDMLVAFGNDQLIYSKDQGLSWHTLTRKGPASFTYWMQKGFQLDRYLITSSPDEIYRIELKVADSMLNIQTVSTEGLNLDKEHVIYDKIKADKYVVIATSRGLFYRTIESFLDGERRE